MNTCIAADLVFIKEHSTEKNSVSTKMEQIIRNLKDEVVGLRQALLDK